MAALADSISHYTKASPLLLAEQPAIPGKRPDFLEPQIWKALSDHLGAKLNSLYAWRQTWWSTNWNDICKYIAPRRSLLLTQGSGGIPTPNSMMRGVPINNQIVDPCATLSLRYCASGMASNLAKPSAPWFKIIPIMLGVNLDAEARKWIETTENRMYGVLDISNFYNQFVQECEDIAAYGTSVAIIYEDEENVIRVHVPVIGEYYLDVDASQRVIGLYRLFLMTVEQMVDFFGIDNCTKDVQDLWKGKGAGLQTEKIIAHAIEPNYVVGTDKNWKLPGKFPWREVYWSYGDAGTQPLACRGFWDKPFAASRWSTQGNDPYGRSQGMDVLPDVKQLQVMTRRMAEAIEKMVRPPLIADDKLKNQPASGLPGHVTYMPGLDAHNGMRSIYNVNPDVAALAQNIEKISARIQKGFFLDVFMPTAQFQKDKERPTVGEVQAQRSEAMQVLGPVVENLITDNLRPKLSRIFSIMKRKNLIDPMPKSLQGMPLGWQFVSTLALAQKAASIGSLDSMAAIFGNLTPVFPDAKAKFNIFQYINERAEMSGTPTTILYDDAKAQATVDAQNKMAQQQQQQQSLHNTAQTASVAADAGQTLASTNLQGGQTALNALVGG